MYSGSTNVGDGAFQSNVTTVRSNTILTGKCGGSIMSEYTVQYHTELNE